uniref:Uncharacterized protein n=1 Tax=Lepeophtheirus salmonis TaxID=72036 RepID=A0A0K2UKR7_LEPSM
MCSTTDSNVTCSKSRSIYSSRTHIFFTNIYVSRGNKDNTSSKSMLV